MNPSTGFDLFWHNFPRKVGKLAAIRSWGKAIKLAKPEEILSAVERYKKGKPAYADWCHPATWLNQGRWMDEYEPQTNGHAKPASVFELKAVMQAKQAEMDKIKNRFSHESAFGLEWDNKDARQSYLGLKQQQADLNRRIAAIPV